MKSNLALASLIALGILSRLLPHAPNVTMVGAITLFSATYFSRPQSLIATLLIMLISDIFIGFHPTIGWVYGSLIVISLLTSKCHDRLKGTNRILLPLMSAGVFFLMTNFGVWITTTMYTKDWAGLLECYTLAIPFFRFTLIGDLLYSGVLFGGWSLVKHLQRHVRNSTQHSSCSYQVWLANHSVGPQPSFHFQDQKFQ